MVKKEPTWKTRRGESGVKGKEEDKGNFGILKNGLLLAFLPKFSLP